jgi:hypothetical protein
MKCSHAQSSSIQFLLFFEKTVLRPLDPGRPEVSGVGCANGTSGTLARRSIGVAGKK